MAQRRGSLARLRSGARTQARTGGPCPAPRTPGPSHRDPRAVPPGGPCPRAGLAGHLHRDTPRPDSRAQDGRWRPNRGSLV